MNFVGRKYYNISRALLWAIGLSPYDKSVLKRIKTLTLLGMSTSLIMAMIAKIITSKYDAIVTLRALSYAIPQMIVFLKYVTFLLIPTFLKKSTKWIEDDWNIFKDVDELEIIQKYIQTGHFYILTFAIIGYGAGFSVLLSIFLPNILDIVMPLNVSRERTFLFEVEYFVDEKKYYYTLYCHIYITLMLGITTEIATESLVVLYISHICGMFKIVSYRLQCAFNLGIHTPVENATIHTRIIAAIEIHKRTLEFHKFLWSKLALSYFLMLVMGVISLSIHLFRLLHTIVETQDADDMLTSAMGVCSHFFYMFCANYAGQVFMDYSTDVYEKMYNTQWYRVPLREQKLLLLILHRSVQSCKLIAGGTFVLSFEGFTSLVATSVSYFTVLSSIQN